MNIELPWWFQRLRCMTPAEVLYRLRQAGLDALEKRGLLGRAAAPVPAALAFPVFVAPTLSDGEAQAILADARRICAGQVTLFASRQFNVGARPQWNRDPESGITGPAVYAGDIGVSRRHLVGDIKHVWELNRHLHLVRLAQAIVLSGESGFVDALQAQLRGWLAQCPPRIGPNWTSALELGIRLINWSLIWRLLGDHGNPLFAGSAGAALRADWLASIHAHCQCIARRPSRHSSANNHLIGEQAGLYVAAMTWPCWPASARWRARARRELEQQAALQFSPDGVNREQAFAYHVFSAEFLFVAALAGPPFGRRFWDDLQRALRFLRSVRDVKGHLPMVGDADDAMVHRLDPQEHDRAGALLELEAALHGGAQPGAAGMRWLLQALPAGRPEPTPLAPATAWAFPDGGYLVFGSGFGSAREIKGLLDCGPLGYLGIAAHGHADALALTLSVAGEPCLVDPGTGSYWQERKWRDYFRGTSAHNTVRVDGLDQSVSGGRFLWLRKAQVTVERMPRSPMQFDFRGSHDGYLRLADPALHIRTVRFDAHSAVLSVLDQVRARKAHRLEQFWHFAPGLNLSLTASAVHVRGNAFGIDIDILGAGFSLELLRGCENPPLGWYSPSYELKQACDVLKITTLSGSAPIECRFTIWFFQ
ncbi:MAG: alginate lyase family protein [Pseudomonadota bacterium]